MRCTTETADKIARLLEGVEGLDARVAVLRRHVDYITVRDRAFDEVWALRYDAYHQKGRTGTRSVCSAEC